MKKQLVSLLFLYSAMTSSSSSFADEQASMLLYIQPIEYTHGINLWQPYRNYWINQGEFVEPIAIEKLRQSYTNISMCEGSQSGKALIWLQPNLFYNPQVQVFYGELTAKVYTGLGKLVGTYVGESKVHGFLNIQADHWISKTYHVAMENLITKMHADTKLEHLSTQTSTEATETPCSMVTLLPTPKIRTTSF